MREFKKEIRKITKDYTREQNFKLAIYSAELVLPIFEKKYPKDNRPRKAIEAAKKCLERNTVENKELSYAASYAADDVYYAADAAYYDDAAAAYYTAGAAYYAARAADYYATRAADYYADVSATGAADFAARAAAYYDDAAAYFAVAAVASAYAAAYYADVAADAADFAADNETKQKIMDYAIKLSEEK